MATTDMATMSSNLVGRPPKAAVHVVLVEPEIPWNTGNAGRTCLALGARLHLVEPLGFCLDERRVRRAGLDYWRHVEPTVWPNWEALEAKLVELGEPFLFTAEAEREHWGIDYPERSVLIFGRESVGLPQRLRQRYSRQLVRIPIVNPTVRSLNVSTALTVALYELLRQRQAPAR